MIVTNYRNDSDIAGNIQQVHEDIQSQDQGMVEVHWCQCPKGTKVIRARFLADRVHRMYGIDHSYTIVKWPDGSMHYLMDPPWGIASGWFRNLGLFKRYIYQVVKKDGNFYPGLFDAINVLC